MVVFLNGEPYKRILTSLKRGLMDKPYNLLFADSGKKDAGNPRTQRSPRNRNGYAYA